MSLYVGDYNRDGAPDLTIEAQRSEFFVTRWFSLGGVHAPLQQFRPTPGSSVFCGSLAAAGLDFDGDGLGEMLGRPGLGFHPSTVSTAFEWDGVDFVRGSQPYPRLLSAARGTAFADLSGDGKIDFVRPAPTSSGAAFEIALGGQDAPATPIAWEYRLDRVWPTYLRIESQSGRGVPLDIPAFLAGTAAVIQVIGYDPTPELPEGLIISNPVVTDL